MVGTKPKFAGAEGPVEGESVVFEIEMQGYPERVAASALLGPGRDYLDFEAAKLGVVETDLVRSTLHGPYATISDLVAAFPNAKLDNTASRMLAYERAIESHRALVAKWEADVEAAGLEICDRCGGHGGAKIWPGWVCFECNGRGTTSKDES